MVDLHSQLNADDWKILPYAIGTVAVYWNLVEHALDYCVALIYKECDGKTVKGCEKGVPMSMTKKLTFLKNRFNNSTPLSSLKDEGISLTKEVLKLSEERNIIIHMRLMGKNSDGSFLFDKLSYKSMHESALKSYTVNQFDEFGRKILNMVEKISCFFKLLRENLGGDLIASDP
jgi:hypothetical protein